MIFKKFIQIFILLILSCLLSHISMAQVTCSIDLRTLNANSYTGHDVWSRACNQDLIHQYWNDFNMGGEDNNWDNGFGYRDPCNVDFPLGRTFSALHWLGRIHEAWYYNYARGDRIKKLVARCQNDRGDWARHFSDRTELYMLFFYGMRYDTNTAMKMANILAHEARHEDGKPHVDCARGPERCDINYSPYYGSYAFSVNVLQEFVFSEHTSPLQKARAGAEANVLLATAFIEDPRFRVAPQDYCQPGSFLDARSNRYFCTPCPERTIASEDQRSCISCPSGSVSNNLIAPTSCVYCQRNEITTSEGICAACPTERGAASVPNLDQTSCLNCPRGYATNDLGTQCLACPEDSIVFRGRCFSCRSSSPSGSLGIPSLTRDSCESCPQGTVVNRTGGCCLSPQNYNNACPISPQIRNERYYYRRQLIPRRLTQSNPVR